MRTHRYWEFWAWVGVILIFAVGIIIRLALWTGGFFALLLLLLAAFGYDPPALSILLLAVGAAVMTELFVMWIPTLLDYLDSKETHD